MTREQIISAYPLDRFLNERGYELRGAGANFVTNACPMAQHKKYHRPVTIDTDKNLWHCNDCKHGGSVIDWVMLEQKITASDAMGLLGSGNNGSSGLVATYDYTDESGNLLYQTCRYQPKDFRQRRPDGKGGWINNLQSVRRVLYRLPEVMAAQTVCVAEGEKDCENLAKLGFLSETLCGKDVIVLRTIPMPLRKYRLEQASQRSPSVCTRPLLHALQLQQRQRHTRAG